MAIEALESPMKNEEYSMKYSTESTDNVIVITLNNISIRYLIVLI